MRLFSRAISATIVSLVFVFPAMSVHAQDASGEQKLMSVDWQDPEISSFVQERASSPPLSVGPEDEATLSQLKLPVLAFDRPPGVVERAFGLQARPQLKRDIVTDPDNPVWYTVVDSYNDITITVEADLRIQQHLPEDTAIYTPPESETQEPNIDIVDGDVEEGMEGLIAEYTVLKFPNIPYKVTIECSPETKKHCVDGDQILKDRAQLKVISARPPG